MPFLRFGEIFCISIYCVYVVSLHIESTDFMIESTDSMILPTLYIIYGLIQVVRSKDLLMPEAAIYS